MKFLEFIINKLIDLRNARARSKAHRDCYCDNCFNNSSNEYFENWSILKTKTRKLTQAEVDDMFV